MDVAIDMLLKAAAFLHVHGFTDFPPPLRRSQAARFDADYERVSNL